MRETISCSTAIVFAAVVLIMIHTSGHLEWASTPSTASCPRMAKSATPVGAVVLLPEHSWQVDWLHRLSPPSPQPYQTQATTHGYSQDPSSLPLQDGPGGAHRALAVAACLVLPPVFPQFVQLNREIGTSWAHDVRQVPTFQFAVFIMLSGYYAFHLEYPKLVKNAMLFFQDYVLSFSDGQRRPATYLATASDIKKQNKKSV